GVSDRVAVVACDCVPPIPGAVPDIASNNPGLLAATSSGWRACPRRTPHPCDSFAVIIAASLPLASRLAANALFRSIDGWLKNLEAVAATQARPHARFLALLGRSFMKTSKENKFRLPREYRNFYRILTASLRVGLKTSNL